MFNVPFTVSPYAEYDSKCLHRDLNRKMYPGEDALPRLKKALEIIGWLSPHFSGSDAEYSLLNKTFKNLELVIKLAEPTNLTGSIGCVLLVAKLASKLLCKYDLSFEKTYIVESINCYVFHEDILPLMFLHANSIFLLRDLCTQQESKFASIALERFEEECVCFLNSFREPQIVTDNLHILGYKNSSVWAHPHLAEVIQDQNPGLKAATWKLGEWYLTISATKAASEIVRNNLYCWFEALHKDHPNDSSPIQITPDVLSQIYERLMAFETREDIRNKIKDFFYKILLEKLDWKKHNRESCGYVFEAFAKECKDYYESHDTPSKSAFEPYILRTVQKGSSVYKEKDIPYLAWKLWAEGLALPTLQEDEGALKFKKMWAIELSSFETIWNKHVEFVGGSAQELNTLSSENKLLHLKCHAKNPDFEKSIVLLKIALLSIELTLHSEKLRELWCSQSHQLSSDTKERLARFWLLGESTLIPFPSEDLPLLNEIMPFLIPLYSLSRRKNAMLLEALQRSADVKFLCKDGEVSCHSIFAVPLFPKLFWKTHEEMQSINCKTLSKAAIGFLLSKTCYKNWPTEWRNIFFKQNVPNASHTLSNAEVVEMLRFVRRFGDVQWEKDFVDIVIKNDRISWDYIVSRFKHPEDQKEYAEKIYGSKSLAWKLLTLVHLRERPWLNIAVLFPKNDLVPILVEMYRMGFWEDYAACWNLLIRNLSNYAVKYNFLAEQAAVHKIVDQLSKELDTKPEDILLHIDTFVEGISLSKVLEMTRADMLRETTDVTLVCKNGQHLLCHKKRVRYALFLDWSEDGIHQVFDCNIPTKRAMAFYLLETSYNIWRDMAQDMAQVMFSKEELKTLDLTDEELVELLQFLKKMGKITFGRFGERVVKIYHHKGEVWNLLRLALIHNEDWLKAAMLRCQNQLPIIFVNMIKKEYWENYAACWQVLIKNLSKEEILKIIQKISFYLKQETDVIIEKIDSCLKGSSLSQLLAN